MFSREKQTLLPKSAVFEMLLGTMENSHKIRTSIPTVLFSVMYAGYVGILALVYWYYICIIFASDGFRRSIENNEILLSCLATIILFLLLPKRNGAVSSVSALSLLLLFAPTSVYVAFGQGGIDTLLITSLALAVTFIVSKSIRVPVPSVPQLSSNALVICIIALTAVYFFAVIFQGGLQFLNFDIRDVYEYRDKAADTLNPIFGYISPVIAKVFIPFLAVYGIANRDRLLATIGIGLGVFMFALTANRSPLFYGFIAVGIYMFHTTSRRFSLGVVGGLIVVIGISAYDLHRFLGDPAEYNGLTGYIGSLFARRALMVPSMLNSAYLDFFAANPKVWWADSKITFGFIQSPYNVTPPFLIGANMFGDPQLSANTGFIGSGYGNAGMLGVILYSVLVGLFFSFLSTVSKVLSARFVVSVSFPIIFTILLSADLLTALLTHGALALILLFSVAYHRDFGSMLDGHESEKHSAFPEETSGDRHLYYP